jgi:type I restriction enzyme, S subunit
MSMPKLRFKDNDESEFPDWQKKNIGEILTIGSGKDYKHLSTGNVPVFGTGGYMLSVNDYLYDGESVCIGRKGTIDKPALLNGKFWTVDTLFYTHSFKNSIPKFVYAIFQRIDWKNHNEASGVPSLSKSTIEKINIQIPSISEQTKIANFLTAVDEKTTQLTQKTELLAQYKKGVMQKIFSQELRFKNDDGSEFPEWEESTLGEIGKFKSGTGFPDSEQGGTSGIPFYKVSDMNLD